MSSHSCTHRKCQPEDRIGLGNSVFLDSEINPTRLGPFSPSSLHFRFFRPYGPLHYVVERRGRGVRNFNVDRRDPNRSF